MERWRDGWREEEKGERGRNWERKRELARGKEREWRKGKDEKGEVK